MGNILIALIWKNTPSILFAVHSLGINKLILLVDKKPQKKQIKSVEIIKTRYSDLVDVRIEHIELFDIPKIVEECVRIIDSLPSEDEVFISVNDSRRTQMVGLMLAAYKRFTRISKMYYFLVEEGTEKMSVELPKLSFDLNKSQKKLLEILAQTKKDDTMNNVRMKTGYTKPMLYRNLRKLQERGMVKKNGIYEITDAGRIALL